MTKVIEAVWFVLIGGAILGSCLYLEKQNRLVYEACIVKAKHVGECEGVR